MESEKKPQIIAHRGSSYNYPEMSRAAYLAAIAEGADAVECDVILTQDKHLVLIHDHDVKRTSNGEGTVGLLTLEAMQEFDFSQGKHPRRGAPVPELDEQLGLKPEDSQRIVTLPELVEIVKNAGREVGLVIETKHPNPYDLEVEHAVLQVLRDGGLLSEDGVMDPRVSIMSFYPPALMAVMNASPETPVVQLLEDLALNIFPPEMQMTEEKKQVLLHQAELSVMHVGRAGPGVEYVRDFPERVAQWREAGIPVRVWTVNTEEDLDAVLGADMNLEAVITDRPKEMRQWMEARGVL